MVSNKISIDSICMKKELIFILLLDKKNLSFDLLIIRVFENLYMEYKFCLFEK